MKFILFNSSPIIIELINAILEIKELVIFEHPISSAELSQTLSNGDTVGKLWFEKPFEKNYMSREDHNTVNKAIQNFLEIPLSQKPIPEQKTP